MRMRRHFHEEESGAIDLAPMLDFVMNLLIFFIITAVFTKELGLTVNRAGASGGESSGETSSVLVTVRGSGEIWIEDRIVDVRAVRANIERLHVQKPEAGVLLVADKDAEAGVLVQVIDQVREGGVQNISFAGTR
ncbi:MAG: biopolymer transporter ExbD [Deltaproteobacteria bacterium]|nr:biopolymer transporter ExbD [Deltaproteobacteria bacterium]